MSLANQTVMITGAAGNMGRCPGGCRALGWARAGESSGARVGADEAWGGFPQRVGNDAWLWKSPWPCGLNQNRG